MLLGVVGGRGRLSGSKPAGRVRGFDGTDGMGASPSVPSCPSDRWSQERLGMSPRTAQRDSTSAVVNDWQTRWCLVAGGDVG